MPEDPRTQAVRRYENEVGGTITALRAIMAKAGFISAADANTVAAVFNISRAEVRGIISFYTDLRTEPLAETVVRICQAEACQAVGCRSLTQEVSKALGVALGETDHVRKVSLEPVYCLGLCANGPAAMVGERLIVCADEGKIMQFLP